MAAYAPARKQAEEAALSQRLVYTLAALIILAIEVCIALFVNDAIIRPYVGDMLAIGLVYCALRAATPLSVRMAIAAALALATLIELAQKFDLLGAMGLGDNRIARIVLGGVFDPMDFAVYAAGAMMIAIIEGARRRS